jgi:hypothetical protein
MQCHPSDESTAAQRYPPIRRIAASLSSDVAPTMAARSTVRRCPRHRRIGWPVGGRPKGVYTFATSFRAILQRVRKPSPLVR